MRNFAQPYGTRFSRPLEVCISSFNGASIGQLKSGLILLRVTRGAAKAVLGSSRQSYF